jgi:pyruvate dehydrogenase E2 component (dihydrolipoamide acetyltransferase)
MVGEVRMPKIGLSEADMILVSWLKKKGQPVKKGESIAVIQGEKLTNELEAEKDGIMQEIFVAEGESVKINTLLANIGA